jgi:N-acetylglutamate synthase-like GNAT family acetyltransferase
VNLAISDLRGRPEFFDVVAERIWSAWWQRRGFSLDHIRGRLQENMNVAAIPFALVAHEGATFVGTSSVIASDLDELPQLTPWVAAVWVEADYRKREVGRALVARAVADILALGIDRAYLCALPARRHFYLRQGWMPIMENVGEHGLTVYVQNRAG